MSEETSKAIMGCCAMLHRLPAIEQAAAIATLSETLGVSAVVRSMLANAQTDEEMANVGRLANKVYEQIKKTL